VRRRYSVHALTPWQFDKHLCCTYPVDAITDCDAIVDPEKKDLDILVITIEVIPNHRLVSRGTSQRSDH
jgi:hypothetical protein